jgi:hypothetical protein
MPLARKSQALSATGAAGGQKASKFRSLSNELGFAQYAATTRYLVTPPPDIMLRLSKLHMIRHKLTCWINLHL